mmetsp:Transcript_7807/g.10443  ORF Transcript_7807/g.10443 Transcript_7807/m.10443 type:complete len:390 (-) Transcript_7807:468-1637(-)
MSSGGRKKGDIKEEGVDHQSDDEVIQGDEEDDGLGLGSQSTMDPKVAEQQELIDKSTPRSQLEIALSEELKRKSSHVERLSGEVQKLKAFISKRKQTYKRKRKDEGAPTRALSAYNIFVQERFSRLAKENEAALKSADTDAQLKRVPPASLVASTGNEWKELSAQDKSRYEDMARNDRKRYEDQMAKYHPPDKQANRKRNKTGYNMFFSAHVLRLKQSEAGVPSERGSVARLVGSAWKELTAEEKQYYEREADKQNDMNPVERDAEDEDEPTPRRGPPEYPPMGAVNSRGDMSVQHGGMPPQLGQAPVVHQPHAQHDQSVYSHGYYDQRMHQAPHHGQHPQQPYGQHDPYAQPQHGYHMARPPHGYSQGYPPQNYPHMRPHDQSGMGNM